MATVEQMLNACRAEIGYREGPGRNNNKYAAMAGHPNRNPWCMTFLVAMARRVGLLLPANTAGTVFMYQSFRNQHRARVLPQQGAFAFYDFPDRIRRVQHVGIVESWTATTVTCIEGNTASGVFGSQSNGGGVFRRTRPRSYVVGYGYPAYTGSPTSTPSAAPVSVPATDRQPTTSQEVPELDGNERATLQQTHDAVARIETMLAAVKPLIPEMNARQGRIGLALGAIKAKLGING